MSLARVLTAAGAALLALGLACAREPARSGDVVALVTIDTLRADRLGCHGDPAARTPHLDRAARRGTQHAMAVATAPLTLPSHATILSGTLPPVHGARDNGSYRVHESTPLVAEAFQDAGWETAAFVAAFPLAARFGLARGFDHYGEATGVRRTGSMSSFAERRASAVNDEVREYLDGRTARDRLFLWVHYFDPHAPYDATRNWTRSVGRDGYRGEIAYTDREFGMLERALVSRFRTVLLALTADHGESLGDHGEDTHGIFVYDATMHVPLSFTGPGFAAGVIEREPVSLTMIAPNLAASAGVAFAPADAPQLEAEVGACYVESAYPRLRHGWAALRGLRTERWKVIRAPEPEIYDVLADPGELDNRFGDPHARAAVDALFRELELDVWDVQPPREEPDPEVEAALASLGYASIPARRDEPAEELPDPKGRVRIERFLGLAHTALEAGDLAGATSALALVKAADPDNKESRLVRARLVAAGGDVEAAYLVYEEALALPPASLDALVYYEMGRLALDLGHWSRAEDAFGRSASLDPLNADAVYNWGLAAYRLDRFDDAVSRWRAALEIDPRHEFALEWIADAEARSRGEAP